MSEKIAKIVAWKLHWETFLECPIIAKLQMNLATLIKEEAYRPFMENSSEIVENLPGKI